MPGSVQQLYRMIDNYKPAFRYGLIMGMIGVVLFLLVWALAPDMMNSYQWQLSQGVLFFLALPIVMEILSARDCKANFDAYSYGNAFLAAFYVGLIAVLVALVFNLMFRYLIDPEFYVSMQDQAMDRAIQRMESQGLSDAQIEQNLERGKWMMEFFMGVGGQVFMSVLQLVWYSILALLIGTIYRDKDPLKEFS